jgi:hypothetical protein
MQPTSQEHRTIEWVIFMHQQIVRRPRRTDRGEGAERIVSNVVIQGASLPPLHFRMG